MSPLLRAAVFGGGVCALGVSLAAAQSAYPSIHAFDIPSKPLLAALADFTATTGIQVIRPGARKLEGLSKPVHGRRDAGTALGMLLDGTGLTFRPTGPRTVMLARTGDAARTGPVGDGVSLEPIDVIGAHERRPAGGDGGYDVTAADIARKNPSDLKDLFRGEAGVQVGSSIPLSQKVYVRGIEENNLAVSIDGAAQNNKVFHHNATTYIDPALIKSVEVDAGVAPADAGFAALAGSIAYETKDVGELLESDGFGGQAKSWFDTNGSVFGTSVAGYGKSKGFEALGFFNTAKGGRFKSGTGERVGGTATDLKSGLAKIAFEADDGDRVELSHERVHDSADRPFRANGEFLVAGFPATRNYRLDRQNTVLNYSDASPEGWWDPRATLGYGSTRIKVPFFERFVPDPVNDSLGKTESLNGRFENRFGFALGSVTAGVDFRRDRARYDWGELDEDEFRPARERMTNVGGYMQARLEPTDRSRLSFGGRVDHQRFRGVQGEGSDRNHSGLSGNLSGEYDLIPELLTAKAGYSHVWGGIPLAENFVMNPDWRYSGEIGDGTGRDGRRLKASVADNLTLGLVARSHGFTLDGSIFGTNIRNARNAKFSNAYDPDMTPRPPLFTGGPALPNLGATFAPDLETRGFELGARYDWERGFVAVRYVHVDIDIDGRPANSDIGNYIAAPTGDLIKIAAAHTIARWALTLGGDIEIAPKYARVGRNRETISPTNPRGDRFPAYPAYEVVNMFAEWKPESLPYETTLRVDVKNLLDRTYSDRASYGQEFVGQVVPLLEAGRSVILSAAVKF